jgi:hypothetical protein
MASAELLDMIGEVRRAKESPADYVALPPRDHTDFTDWLLTGVTPPPPTAPAVCLLDSGVVTNPIIAPALSDDCHRWRQSGEATFEQGQEEGLAVPTSPDQRSRGDSE